MCVCVCVCFQKLCYSKGNFHISPVFLLFILIEFRQSLLGHVTAYFLYVVFIFIFFKISINKTSISLLWIGVLYLIYNIISYQLFWSMIQLISRNQRAVSPEAQPRVIQPSDCEI